MLDPIEDLVGGDMLAAAERAKDLQPLWRDALTGRSQPRRDRARLDGSRLTRRVPASLLVGGLLVLVQRALSLARRGNMSPTLGIDVPAATPIVAGVLDQSLSRSLVSHEAQLRPVATASHLDNGLNRSRRSPWSFACPVDLTTPSP